MRRYSRFVLVLMFLNLISIIKYSCLIILIYSDSIICFGMLLIFESKNIVISSLTCTINTIVIIFIFIMVIIVYLFFFFIYLLYVLSSIIFSSYFFILFIYC